MNNESSSLLDGLRRFYNSVEIFFDRRSLIEEVRLSRTIESQNKPVTARQAFLPCLSIAREFDRGAQLKLIVCPDGNIEQDGISPRWEFFFDLPKRHAKMNCAWFLTWNENADVFDTARIEIVARPFPPQDSSLRKLVKDGKILYRQLTGMWDAEYRRKANLPHRFRDSDNVMREFAQKGLNLTETKITLIAEHNKENNRFGKLTPARLLFPLGLFNIRFPGGKNFKNLNLFSYSPCDTILTRNKRISPGLIIFA